MTEPTILSILPPNYAGLLLPYPALSCPFLPFLALSCPFLPFPTLCCPFPDLDLLEYLPGHNCDIPWQESEKMCHWVLIQSGPSIIIKMAVETRYEGPSSISRYFIVALILIKALALPPDFSTWYQPPIIHTSAPRSHTQSRSGPAQPLRKGQAIPLPGEGEQSMASQEVGEAAQKQVEEENMDNNQAEASASWRNRDPEKVKDKELQGPHAAIEQASILIQQPSQVHKKQHDSKEKKEESEKEESEKEKEKEEEGSKEEEEKMSEKSEKKKEEKDEESEEEEKMSEESEEEESEGEALWKWIKEAAETLYGRVDEFFQEWGLWEKLEKMQEEYLGQMRSRQPRESIYYPINFASMYGGARVVMKSSQSIKSVNSILDDSFDKYLYTRDPMPIKIIIGLNEEIAIDSITVQSFEMYSRIIKLFKVEGKFTLEDKKWVWLGTFKPVDQFGDQEFFTENKIVRYIRLTFLESHGQWSYFTLTQVKIRGKGLFADALTEITNQKYQPTLSQDREDALSNQWAPAGAQDQSRGGSLRKPGLESEDFDEDEEQVSMISEQPFCRNQFKPTSEEPHESNLIVSLINKISSLEDRGAVQEKTIRQLESILEDSVRELQDRHEEYQKNLEAQVRDQKMMHDLLAQWCMGVALGLGGLLVGMLVICLCGRGAGSVPGQGEERRKGSGGNMRIETPKLPDKIAKMDFSTIANRKKDSERKRRQEIWTNENQQGQEREQSTKKNN